MIKFTNIRTMFFNNILQSYPNRAYMPGQYLPFHVNVNLFYRQLFTHPEKPQYKNQKYFGTLSMQNIRRCSSSVINYSEIKQHIKLDKMQLELREDLLKNYVGYRNNKILKVQKSLREAAVLEMKSKLKLDIFRTYFDIKYGKECKLKDIFSEILKAYSYDSQIDLVIAKYIVKQFNEYKENSNPKSHSNNNPHLFIKLSDLRELRTRLRIDSIEIADFSINEEVEHGTKALQVINQDQIKALNDPNSFYNIKMLSLRCKIYETLSERQLQIDEHSYNLFLLKSERKYFKHFSDSTMSSINDDMHRSQQRIEIAEAELDILTISFKEAEQSIDAKHTFSFDDLDKYREELNIPLRWR